MATRASSIDTLRRVPRVPLRAALELSQGRDAWRAETADLGPGGCLVVSPRRLEPSAPVTLVVRCEGVADALRASGVVAWAAEGRTGVAFASRSGWTSVRPDRWFEQILRARPRLGSALRRVPGRIALDSPLFLVPPPRAGLRLTAPEAALVRNTGHGTSVQALLEGTGLATETGRRALFSLLEKGVLTLSLGEAGEAWRWRAVLESAEESCSAPERGEAVLGVRAAEPVAAARSAIAPRGGSSTGPDISPRRAEAPSRSWKAQRSLDDALRAMRAGRMEHAMLLLRQALLLSPNDPHVSTLLGELASRARPSAR